MMTYPSEVDPRHASSTRPVTDKIESAAKQATDYATAKAGEIYDKVDKTVSDVTDQGREASESVQKVAGNLGAAVRKSLKEQPTATLAVAATMGFVLGALWKS